MYARYVCFIWKESGVGPFFAFDDRDPQECRRRAIAIGSTYMQWLIYDRDEDLIFATKHQYGDYDEWRAMECRALIREIEEKC
jgi:hypothetical protein